MHNNNISARIFKKCADFLDKSCGFLSVLFWIFALFGFDGGTITLHTLAAILIHEAGHLAAMTLIGAPASLPSARPRGLLIKCGRILSYNEEFLVAMAGPLANVLTTLVALPFGAAARELSSVSLVTALSNLIPIKGYDGYRMIDAMLSRHGFSGGCRLLSRISFAIAVAALFLSLYAIWRFDAGYWIFGVFFVFILKEVKISVSRQFARFSEISRDFERF